MLLQHIPNTLQGAIFIPFSRNAGEGGRMPDEGTKILAKLSHPGVRHTLSDSWKGDYKLRVLKGHKKGKN